MKTFKKTLIVAATIFSVSLSTIANDDNVERSNDYQINELLEMEVYIYPLFLNRLLGIGGDSVEAKTVPCWPIDECIPKLPPKAS